MANQKAMSNMNKAELINIAQEQGIYTPEMDNMKKADIISAIKGKDEEPTAAEAAEAKLLSGSKIECSFYAMREAIAGAFKAGNRHAITKDEAYIGNASEDSWKAWKIWTEQTFYDAVRAYYVAKVSRNENKRELENAAWKVWRSILAMGKETDFHKNFYMEEDDIVHFFGFIQTRGSIEGVGGYWATVGRQNFRKEVEFMVGARMAAAIVANDADHELITAYVGKQRTIVTMNERLDGKENADGKHEPGIVESIAGIKKSIEKFANDLREQLNATDEQVKTFTAKLREELAELEKQEKSARNSIAEAEKYLKEHKGDYEAAVDRCGKTIEGIATE